MAKHFGVSQSFTSTIGTGSSSFVDLFVDQPGDVLGRGILVEQVERLAHLLEHRHDRVVAVEEHPVVEVVVDPGAHGRLDVGEVDQHPAVVELGRPRS